MFSVKELILHHLRTCIDRLRGTLEKRINNPDEYRRMENIIQQLREKYESAVEKHSKYMEVSSEFLFSDSLMFILIYYCA